MTSTRFTFPPRARRAAAALCCAALLLPAGCAGRSRGGDLRGSAPLQHSRQQTHPMQQRTPAPQPSAQPPAQAPAPQQPLDVRALLIFRGHSAAPAITWDALVEQLALADVILFGEVHAHPTGLDAAATLFEDLLISAPTTALSMEFFDRDDQPHIDDYLAGVTTDETFRKATARAEGNYPPGHQRMVDAAKAARRPVAGANAPRRYVRLARTEGYDRLFALRDSQRQLFVVPRDLTEGRYREEFMRMMGSMGGHSADAPPADEAAAAQAAEKARETALSFFRSQNVWDATMAESIRALSATGARPIVHVVGQFHTDFDGGLTQRVKAALPSARVITLSFVDESASELRAGDTGRADFVIYTGAQ